MRGDGDTTMPTWCRDVWCGVRGKRIELACRTTPGSWARSFALDSAAGSGGCAGEGDGDDECVLMNLEGISSDVNKIVVAVTIHDADLRRQNFGQVNNAFIRILNAEGGVEIARYDLSEDASTETAMIFGEVYRHNNEWKFRAVGQGFAGGLAPLATHYGVSIA